MPHAYTGARVDERYGTRGDGGGKRRAAARRGGNGFAECAGRILLSLGFALLVLIGLTLFADSRKLAGALRDFAGRSSCRSCSHAHQLRASLPQVAILPAPDRYQRSATGLSLRIFFSGFVMAITPR